MKYGRALLLLVLAMIFAIGLGTPRLWAISGGGSGAPGPTGATGATGATGPTGPTGSPGAGSSPAPALVLGNGTNSTWQAVANQTKLCDVVFPVAVTFSNIGLNVHSGDAGASKYDYGFYSHAGTLLADVAADATNGFTPFGSTNSITHPVLNGPVTLPAGRYYFAWTSNGTAGAIDGGPLSAAIAGYQMSLYCTNTNNGTTTNGKLLATITPPADAITSGNVPFYLY